jgi:DNA-binding CsgD family transcriptional regulator
MKHGQALEELAASLAGCRAVLGQSQEHCMHNLKDDIMQYLEDTRSSPASLAPTDDYLSGFCWGPGGSKGATDSQSVALPGLLALVLDQLDFGVIVCDEHAHLKMANDAARRELLLGDPLWVNANADVCVSRTRPEVAIQWRAALSDAVRGQRRHMLRLWSNSVHLMATVLPLAPLEAGGAVLALVLLSRRQVATDIMVTLFAKVWGLTGAEAEVLMGLANGARLEDLARTRKVKLSTLRAQSASLRAKTGVRRVEDLLLMVAGLPPTAGALRCSKTQPSAPALPQVSTAFFTSKLPTQRLLHTVSLAVPL